MCCFLGKKMSNFELPRLKTPQPLLPYSVYTYLALKNNEDINFLVSTFKKSSKSLIQIICTLSYAYPQKILFHDLSNAQDSNQNLVASLI